MRVPEKRLLCGDIVLCVCVFALALFFLFVPFLSEVEAETVEISGDSGKASYPLDEDREITVESNSHSLTVVIENGEAYVSHSDCTDGICKSTGRISKAGESIICVPARAVVTVIGESEVDYALR